VALSAPALFRSRPDLLTQPVGDERVVYDPRTDAVHVLNQSAAIVWDGLAAGCDRAALVARLAAADPARDAGQVEAELDQVLADLDRAALLATAPVPAASGLSSRQPAAASDPVRAALARLAEGDPSGAERMLRGALDQRPDDPIVLGNLASVLFLSGASDEPATLYERALAADPKRPDLWSNLGNVRRRQGRNEEAASCYARALELAPGHVDAACNFASLRAAEGRGEEAIALWRSAAADDPAASLPVVSEARFHTERGDRGRAEALLRGALEARPSDSELWNALGVVQSLGERRDEAIESFERASVARPSHAAAARNLLHLLAAAERWDDVEAHAARLASALPDLDAIPVATARAHVAGGRRAEAIAVLRESLGRPTVALACADELVGLHLRAGERAEALLVYAAVAQRLDERQLDRLPRLAAVHRRAAEWRDRPRATTDA